MIIKFELDLPFTDTKAAQKFVNFLAALVNKFSEPQLTKLANKNVTMVSTMIKKFV